MLISGNGTRRSYLPAVGLLAVGAIVWFGLNQSAPYGPLVLGWIAPPTALAVSALAVHRTASMAGLPAGARRFWNGIAIVCVVRAFRPYRINEPTVAQCFYLVRAELAVILAVLLTKINSIFPTRWIIADASTPCRN